jgi:maltose alpha-D-glucosyltransferase/alpha-amylase
MRYDWRGNSLVIVHNFDSTPLEIRLKTDKDDDGRLVNLLVNDESRADANSNHRMALEAYGYRWFRVGNLNYSLQRKRI